MAIGTIVGTLERIQTKQGRPSLVVVKLTCTAGAAGGAAGDHLYPATIINDLANVVDYDLRGLRLYSCATIPGTTGPTDNSDITLTDRYGIDILAGAGANIVDNATSNRVVIGCTSAVIITGDITVNITGNLVDSALTTVILEFIGI